MTAEPIQVLLVEDNPGDARLVRLMLAEHATPGYSVTHVTHLGAAIEHIASGVPDVILLDLNLPDARGFPTFARVGQAAPATPILVMTGVDDQNLATEAVRQGAQDYLVKGQLDPHLLTHGIQYAIERKRSEGRIQKLLQRQIAVNRLADALGRAADLSEIYRTISVHLSGLMDIEAFIVSSYDERDRLIRAEYVFTRGGGVEDPARLSPIPLDPLGNSPQSQVVLTGKALHIPDWGAIFHRVSAVRIRDGDAEADATSTAVDSTAVDSTEDQSIMIHSAIMSPMQVGEKTVGVMQAQSYLHNAYSQEDVELFIALANVAALAVQNARLLHDLRHSNAELSQERASLARRVEERTAALQAANAELAQTARLKDEFMANMSHELRTPLNAVLGLAQALEEGALGDISDPQRKALKSIEQSAGHLLAIINDILDISKIEAGKIELDLVRVDVEQLCDAALQMVRIQAAKKGIGIETAYDPGVYTIIADARRLKQVLVNLLGNAVKFTPEGGRVGLVVEGQAHDDAVLFSVWDTGIGIPPETIKLLFRPFVQLDAGRARRYEGTGLGLALAGRLVQLHGGAITAQSPAAEGRGSRFTVRLPWRRCCTDLPAGDGGDLARSPGPCQDPAQCVAHILLVDDPHDGIDPLIPHLERIGYRLTVTHEGRQALEKASLLQPDLIIVDDHLLDQRGLEVVRSLRAEYPLARTPILALSAASSPDDEPTWRAAGADGYLHKPVQLRALADAIAARLARSHYERA
jgi:signal transduction histidine kinase/DNA-binding response OmpR family regulator